VSGLADIISVFNFSPHVVEQVEGNFYISNVSAECCALLCVTCLIAGQHARLIYMDCERKPHELYPPELQ
jgi:hypothetical protein